MLTGYTVAVPIPDKKSKQYVARTETTFTVHLEGVREY